MEKEVFNFGVITLDDYQNKAWEFAVAAAPPEERVMGLLEEAGEVAGVFKRLMRGDFGPELAAVKLEKELGDILWYIAGVAKDNGWTLSSVAQANLDKLQDRKMRNVLQGSGDSR